MLSEIAYTKYMQEAPKKYKVLLIDDDKFLLDMYSLKFKEQGLDVEVGYGGEEGVRKLKEGSTPDALVLDIVMPGTDGFAVLEAVRKEKLGGDPAIIVLSNQGQESDIKRATELGADGYIVKASAVPSEVLEQVLKIIEEHSKKSHGV